MIAYNRFSSLNPGETGSTAAGKPSFEIDLPNAGTSYIIGNVIQQPASNSNSTMVAYGEEGATNVGSDLYVINNTFLNDMGSGGTFLFVSGKVPTPAIAQNNIFAGVGTFSTQATTVDKTNYRAAAPTFVNRAAYDLHPVGSALMIDAGSDPGVSAKGVSLTPVAQYKHVAGGEARPVVGQLDIGAYESSTAPTTSTATSWTACANEGATCSFSGTREVRFGANGVYTSKIITGSTPCTTAVFGDPIYGVAKTCSYSSSTVTTAPTTTPTFTMCATEGGTCSFSGKREVRYGTSTIYTSKVLTGPVACNNTTFGDPAHGQVKSCSYSSVTQ
jgi:spore coat protein U-like protein